MQLPRLTVLTTCLLVGGVACGGSNATDQVDQVDPIDAAVAAPDADPGQITVSLRRGPVPVPGAPVIGHDAEGEPLEQTTTDAAGDATLSAAGVAMVTVIDPDDVSLYTAAGVAAGDHLTIPTFTATAELGTFAVAVPAPPVDAAYVQVHVGLCTGGGPVGDGPYQVAMDEYCLGTSGTAAILAMTTNANSDVIAVTSMAGVSAPAFGDVAAVDLPTWSTAFDEFHLTVAGGNLGDLSNSTYGQTIDGLEYFLPSKSANMPYVWWNPVPALGGYVNYSTQLNFGQPTPGGNYAAKRFYGRRLPVGTLTDAVDLPADVMTGLSATGVDTGELARPIVSWAPSQPITADGVLVKTRWFGADYREWSFMMPSDQLELRAPRLPDELAALWAPDAEVSQPYAVVVDTSYHASYDEFRTDGFALVGGPAYLDDGEAELKASVYFPAPF